MAREDLFEGCNVYDNHVAFWGSCFSNFYPCEFTLEGKTWKTSEHYFMWKKAIFFNDVETANKILEVEHPRDAKKLGRQVKGFNEEEWALVSFHIMYDGVYAKFSQNEDLKRALLNENFTGKHFVEGSPVDNIWGVGVSYEDPRVDDENNWTGKNWLGKILDIVRCRVR